MDWRTDCILPFLWELHINPCIICTEQQTVYCPSNGVTHKPMYHMDWRRDCILPFLWGLHINPCIIWTGEQTVYYPSNGDYR